MSTVLKSAVLDPEVYRPDFPILSNAGRNGTPLVYLDNAATSQRPRQVIQAIVDTYEQHYGSVHRGIHRLSDRTTNLYEEARRKVCALINAPTVEQVVFTSGATGAINLVARSWGDANVRPGDEIVVTEMEHHSNLVPWLQLAERTGAVIRHVPVTDNGRLDLDALDRLLNERTRLVALTAISNVLGTINPIGKIVERVHDAGALVLVDGAQSVPHQETDVAALDVDFLAFSGHKMLGPSGAGVLYGKRELLEAMPPFLGGGGMVRRARLDAFQPADLPDKFEAGTPPIVPAIGLGAAIDYLRDVGLDAICQHERRLTERAHELLQSIGGIRVLGPPPGDKAGIVSFTMDRIHAHDVAQLLDRHGIAVRAGHHCAMPLHRRFRVAASTRASFYLYNTLAEIDRLGEALIRVKHVFRRRN